MLHRGLLVVLICLSVTITNVAASCDAESITIKDPVSGSIQCQECRKCPAGEGLSVSCGDVISSSTPIVCKPCVLGESYSSAYEAGACKDCENCGPYRETIKACTLTSKAVCDKCKVGAYEEPMLSMCKPCSPCCNDGNDIVVPECQVPGVPKNIQCTFMKSEKCGKLITKADISTTALALQTTWPSTVPITHNDTEAPTQAGVKTPSKQRDYPSESSTSGATNGPAKGSSINWAVGVAAVGALLILVAVPAAVKYFKAKRKQVRTNDDIELQRVQTDDEVNGRDEDETDEDNPEDALLESNQVLPLHGAEKARDSHLLTGTHDDTKTQQVRGEIDEPNPEEAQVPFSVQETPSDSPLLKGTQDDTETQQVKTNDGGETDVPNPVDDLLEDTQESTGVEETLDSPLPTGFEETQEPGPHRGTGFNTIQEPRPGPSCEHHSYTKIQKTRTVEEVTETCVTCTTPNCQQGCRCQL
ncbi:uncharacterized protein LOC110066785 isoform X2 [Orbicella faveolata]|nr:uncharacterized protein LOC110066785 isoform X2 [Orbicella faveolata]XP_020629688.1 uncharacterized protein LOC110066785 isoform X2 [Orbicella faveolata]XP_020629689.1 uncharacterized protein LOC110066785 isoform X2 [Orbicella faveolata]XP_020629690.1 uncharacterized protein LOC110066785 isoform X2 [Orbicella faveolata]XP_020629691.1 uncharacterized protein LOC110066785 isoform X2 [Orbicella faveolata]XP_020629692.1 uncharacterized protein LOC110066785 isoform X2 [Orbicella faveolata]XP_02